MTAKTYIDQMHRVIDAYLAIFPERTLHYLGLAFMISSPEWEEGRFYNTNADLMRAMLSELSEHFTTEAVAMGWETPEGGTI